MSKQVFDCKRQGELMSMNKKCIKNKKLSNIDGVLALLMYLQSQGMMTLEVNTDKIQSSVEALLSTITENTIIVFPSDGNPSIVDSNLGIPLTGSIASGFMLGITKRG
jgi:hypothetical protein